jgi:uncharacterized protein (DUF849 family)
MVPTKEITPHVPVTAEEIISTVVRCSELGVRVAHIHQRDPETGLPTWKKDILAKIISGIREKTDKVLISATTSGRFWKDFERRSECLDLAGDLKPDLASLTVGSNNFIKSASVNSPQMIADLATKMMDKGIKPELEIFEPGMVHKANILLKKGIIRDEAPYFNILLGSLGTSPLHPATFGAIHALLPTNAIWSLAGIGQFQLQANMIGLAFGGHIRIGLEDNIFFNRKTKELATNEQLLERILGIMNQMGVEPATPSETRCLMKIK